MITCIVFAKSVSCLVKDTLLINMNKKKLLNIFRAHNWPVFIVLIVYCTVVYKLFIIQCAVCSDQLAVCSVMYIIHYTVYFVYCVSINCQWDVYYTSYSVQRYLYGLLYSAQCTKYTFYIIYSVQCILYITHCAVWLNWRCAVGCIFYIILCAVCTCSVFYIRYTVCSVYHTLYTVCNCVAQLAGRERASDCLSAPEESTLSLNPNQLSLFYFTKILKQ